MFNVDIAEGKKVKERKATSHHKKTDY